MKRVPVVVSWSGGKDSSLALAAVLSNPAYEVAALLTTCTAGYDRISMHGVRVALLEQQAAAIGLPLRKVFISQQASNAEYEAKTLVALLQLQTEGVNTAVFGDLFLEDIREYRNRLLAQIGMQPLYPIWGQNTAALAREFIVHGFKAVLVCVNGRVLDGGFAGRDYDWQLLDDLPQTCDPCGENGEFHTFVHAGPIFRQHDLKISRGETVNRSGYHFCDLLPSFPITPETPQTLS